MSLERKQQQIRFREDEQRRIRRVAKAKRMSVQTFAHAAVMAAVLDEEAAIRDGKQGRAPGDDDRRRGGDEAEGLGIRAALAEESATDEPAPAAAATPTVVVHAGGGAAAPAGDVVARLAAGVADGPAWDRQARLRKAVDALRLLAKTDEEREDLARKLDAAVAEADRRAGRAPADVATFDKLKHLLGFG